MSALSPFVRAFRALGSALHHEAELRMDRPGKVAPVSPLAYKHEPTSLMLGSLAQAFERSASDLEQQIAADCARPGPLGRDVRLHCPACGALVAAVVGNGDLGAVVGDTVCPSCVEPITIERVDDGLIVKRRTGS